MSEEAPPKRRKRRQHPGIIDNNRRQFLEASERKREALALYVRGAKSADIAKALGIDITTVRHYLKDAIDEARESFRQDAAALIELSCLQIEEAILQANKDLARATAVKERVQLQTLLIKLRDERARYKGLHAPERHELSFAGVDVRKLSDEELERIEVGDFSVLNGHRAAAADASGVGSAGAAPKGDAEEPH